MGRQKETKIFDSFFIFVRRMIMCVVIFAVFALAFFRESLPAPVKTAINSFAGENSGENAEDLVPHRFRIEKNSEIQSGSLLQTQQSEQIDKFSQNHIIEPVFATGQMPKANENTELEKLHSELIHLGATSCRLTFWGNDDQMYRFSCQIPVSPSQPNTTRHFQSIAPDADQAMHEVVDQVRQWQISR